MICRPSPTGGTRRYLNSAASGVRKFYYDGDQEIEETGNLATDVRRRYVRLPARARGRADFQLTAFAVGSMNRS